MNDARGRAGAAERGLPQVTRRPSPQVDQNDRLRLAGIRRRRPGRARHLDPRHLVLQRLGEPLRERRVARDHVQLEQLGRVLGDLARSRAPRALSAECHRGRARRGAECMTMVGFVASPAAVDARRASRPSARSRLRSSKMRAASSSTIWVLMSASGRTSLG